MRLHHTDKISMLDLQRKRASFNQPQLSHFLYGSKQSFEEFQQTLALVANDPVMKFDPSVLHQSRANMMTAYAKKMIRFHNHFPLDGTNQDLKTSIFCHATPLSLHGLMFLKTLQNLCDEEQEKLILQPALRGEITGCYAQTELAHGSDVQNLLTTATYDPSTESFVINTPEIGAAKWWIGDMGLYANHAAVFAQLIIGGKKYGVHCFLVPIRDPATLKPLKGIELGDIGPKHGFQNKDNGYAIFNNFRIPRRNMLMKYHLVSKEGVYSIQGDQKISYATMLLTRSGLTNILANQLAKATTIATRYSIVRTQFKNAKGQEISVFDYQTQQEKVIPRIAESYAAWFASNHLRNLSGNVVQDAKKGSFKQLNEAHILTSGIKAIFSFDAMRGFEILRRSAGGHGFHYYNGIIPTQIENTPVLTLEGQYTVLLIQVARFLLKSLSHLAKGKPLSESVQYFQQILKGQLTVNISSAKSLDCPYFIQKVLILHSCGKIKALSDKFTELLGQKLTAKEIEDHYAGMLMSDAAIAHMHVVIYTYFLKAVESVTDSKIKAVLTKLLLLYGIEKIIDRSAKLFETSTVAPEAFSLFFSKRESLFEALRPESLCLMQAFGYDDNSLMSAIGDSKGKPYETLLEWANKYNTINRKEERDQIVSAIKKSKSQLRPRL